MRNILSSLLIFLWMTLICGVIYPLVITFIAHFTMNEQAQGSLAYVNGKLVGSYLIAQKFESDKYFWPRPSAINYNPLPSGGSNLGPTSRALKDLVEKRKERLTLAHGLDSKADVPSELLFASGSGLDPHISLNAAEFQMARVMKARGLQDKDKEEFKKLILKSSDQRRLILTGQSLINVLKLNLALDERYPQASASP